MNPSALAIANRPKDFLMHLQLMHALFDHRITVEIVYNKDQTTIYARKVRINDEVILYRLRDEYISITHYETQNKKGLKNSFKSIIIFFCIVAKSLPEIKMIRADIEWKPHLINRPMTEDRMIEFYKRIHGGTVYQRKNGRKWIEFSMSGVRDQNSDQPRYLKQLVKAYYSS